MDHARALRDIVAGGFALLMSAITNVPDAVLALLAMMALDILSGMIAGGKAGKLNSSVSAAGLKRKAHILIIILAVAVLQKLAEIQLPISIVTAVALFYCAHEAISILENAAEAGLPIPDLVKQALEKLHQQTQTTNCSSREEDL